MPEFTHRRVVIDYGCARYAKVLMPTPRGTAVAQRQLRKKTLEVPERTWRELERQLDGWKNFEDAQ